MTLDVFVSNLDPAALLIFSKHKILLVKEEGDTSQACQQYHQQVANQDKHQQRHLLDKLCTTMKGVIDQYSLVLITNHALNKTRGHFWRSYFETANLLPSTRVSFDFLKETNVFKGRRLILL